MANTTQIPITSAEWTAQDLPAGLSFTNGVLTGTPTAPKGRYQATVQVQTPWGRTSKIIPITIREAWKFGYRIKKDNPDPYERVEYLFDAKGMTPAHMDYTTGVFDYGSWADVDFVTDNKPLMLKYDGTVDYYLDPNDYSKKADGSDSDVADFSYEGNAMAQFPLIWVHRYEDDEYEYEIISNKQLDENYKAYAHTRADGSIMSYFYWSMFGGSGDGTRIRSISGKSLNHSGTAQQEIDWCKANGDLWYTHTWSQHELIRTLVVLLGKSTDTQTVFGYGNCRSARDASGMHGTGSLNDKGQFYGYNYPTGQVKVFHVEKFWGDQWDRTAGLIYYHNKVYAKMTPEGAGYRINDVEGYTDTGITLSVENSHGLVSVSCGEYGIIPIKVSASNGLHAQYYCDGGWAGDTSNSLTYLLSGYGADDASGTGGGFSFALNIPPSGAGWYYGCGLSCQQPAAA